MKAKISFARLVVVFVETSQTLPSILFFTAIAYEQHRIVAINETVTRFSRLQVDRAGSEMSCAISCILNLAVRIQFPSANEKIRISCCVQSHWSVTNYAEWLWGRLRMSKHLVNSTIKKFR